MPLLLATLFLVGGTSPQVYASDPRIKPLLQEALKLYSERQYVRALDLFKQVQRIDPANETSLEYIKSSEQRILEWETQGVDVDGKKPTTTWESLLDPASRRKGKVESLANAKDIIAARRSLVQRMKSRSLNTDNIVKIEDSRKGFVVTLFHDQLFLPGLKTLRDESLPILANVADLIRSSGERNITIKSISHGNSRDPFLLYPSFNSEGTDPTLPRMGANKDDTSFLFQDIESTRAFILFTYLAQRSIVNPKSKAGR